LYIKTQNTFKNTKTLQPEKSLKRTT